MKTMNHSSQKKFNPERIFAQSPLTDRTEPEDADDVLDVGRALVEPEPSAVADDSPALSLCRLDSTGKQVCARNSGRTIR